MQLAAVARRGGRRRRALAGVDLDRRRRTRMMADDVPAGARADEAVGGHQLAVGEDLAAYHDGEAAAADPPFADAAHARRFGMAQDAAPALQDVAALVQRRLAGMQADHGAGRRPDVLHRLVVAVVEGAIEGAVGGQHRIALLIVEVRQQRWRAGGAARHSTVETPYSVLTCHPERSEGPLLRVSERSLT